MNHGIWLRLISDHIALAAGSENRANYRIYRVGQWLLNSVRKKHSIKKFISNKTDLAAQLMLYMLDLLDLYTLTLLTQYVGSFIFILLVFATIQLF